MSECKHSGIVPSLNKATFHCMDCHMDFTAPAFYVLVRDKMLPAKDARILELLEERGASLQMVNILRNVAYEYDNNWRENSPRWQRYLEALQTDKE